MTIARTAFLLVLLLPLLGKSQVSSIEDNPKEEDFQIWGDVSLKFDLPKKFFASYEQGWRMKENAALTDVMYSDVAVSREFFKKYEWGVGYRAKYGGDRLYMQNRLYSDLRRSFKVKRVGLHVRLRYQYQFDYDDPADHKLRYRLGGKWSKKKSDWAFYGSGELFTLYEGGAFYQQKIRAVVGTQYKFSKKSAIKLFAGEEWGESRNDFMLGFSYQQKIKVKKKKKEEESN